MRSWKWLLACAALLAIIVPTGTALAHSGYWHRHTVRTRWGTVTVWQWHRHNHDDRQERYRECVQRAEERYQWRLQSIDNGDLTPQEKRVQRELARRQYEIAKQDCKAILYGEDSYNAVG